MITKEEEILLEHLGEQGFSNLANDGVLHLICEAMIEYKEKPSDNNEVLDLVSKSFTDEQLVDMHDDAYSESFDEWKSKWF